MKGRSPNAEERKWLDRIVELGCIVCRLHEGLYTPTEIHHIGGKTKPSAHLNAIPLCFFHHRGSEDTAAYVSRHPWKVRFEDRYGTEEYLLDRVKNLIDEQENA